MPSLTITTRQTASGKRYVVRYRLGGRAYPVRHAGSFRTEREAKARRDLVGGEIAAGRNPQLLLETMATTSIVRTLASCAEQYQASRVDMAEQTRQKIGSHLKAILPVLGDRDPETITHADVQAWVVGLRMKPASVKRYLATLRLMLDHAGVDPNPARDQRVRLPREEHEEINPPSGATVAAIIAAAPERHRLLLRTLAESGMRVGELHQLEWQDVDVAESRFRVRKGKTARARRWVPVSSELIYEITGLVPPDDRAAERRVFPGSTPQAIGMMMRRACVSAGVAHHTPHDLRHRWISMQVKRGVPITEIAATVGHSSSKLTLDTYAHVMVDD